MTSESLCTFQTLRLPRGLWRDLEETVIQQDRQFLTFMARELGLPVQEVLRRCLGTGAPQAVPVLWMPHTATEEVDEEEDEDGVASSAAICPWWECHGDGLWRRCPRLRLSATLPCQIHERCTPCPRARMDHDPHLADIPVYKPIRHKGRLYWFDPTDSAAPVYAEDGTREPGVCIRKVRSSEEPMLVWDATGAS
jgi:hypothetical protein